MWRNDVPCDQPAVQGNDFELIPTVTVESRYSIDGPTVVTFHRSISLGSYGVRVRVKSEIVQDFPEKVPV